MKLLMAVWLLMPLDQPPTPPPSHCQDRPQTAQIPIPVLVPMPDIYGGKRPLPFYGTPPIPVNQPQVGC